VLPVILCASMKRAYLTDAAAVCDMTPVSTARKYINNLTLSVKAAWLQRNSLALAFWRRVAYHRAVNVSAKAKIVTRRAAGLCRRTRARVGVRRLSNIVTLSLNA